MNDPYNVLGVDPSASDDEVKRAYRELARKYHPDNYQDNPLADLAEEKMKEINEAYDAITRARAGGGGQASGGTQRQYQSQYSYQSQATGDVTYAQIRQCINIGDLGRAEQLLRTVSQQNAEWHYLYGYVAYRKGWLDEATQHFQTAYAMEPGNPEYRQAVTMMQQGGAGYRPAGYGATGCDPCTTYMCISCLTPWGGPCC